MKIKILFLAFLSLCFSAQAQESDGWVVLSEPIRLEAPELFQKEEKGDKEKEVVFLKKWGEETFLLHFPEDPSYQVLASGALEVQSGPHRVVVTPLAPGDSPSGDWDSWLKKEEKRVLFSQAADGKFVSSYASRESLYQFETQGGENQGAAHMAFLRSFHL